MLKTIRVARYVTPLREGGSLPAIVEGDDQGLYVMKLSGAGQGRRALIAELIAGTLAGALGLRVPELAFLDLDLAISRNEPDPEIRDLLKASAGINIGLDYLPGSLNYDPLAGTLPESQLASDVVWFDAFITNVDRTAKNTNLLTWHRNLWLIDHGASLYFHHTWQDFLERSRTAFPQVKDHVLLPLASRLEDSHPRLVAKLDDAVLRRAVEAIPDDWLVQDSPFHSAAEHRKGYLAYLESRLESAHVFLEEALRAHALLV
jgi:hypothetical protein